MCELLRCLCTPGALPLGAAVELACFSAAFAAGAAAQTSSTPAGAPAQGARASPAAEASAPVRVRLASLAQCQVGAHDCHSAVLNFACLQCRKPFLVPGQPGAVPGAHVQSPQRPADILFWLD